ncbi:MAG: hypothetical protein R3F36_07960 [Candidatus Competibacteraceae bacterium]
MALSITSMAGAEESKDDLRERVEARWTALIAGDFFGSSLPV